MTSEKLFIAEIEGNSDSPDPLELTPQIHLTKDTISEDKIEMGKKASIDEAGGDEREESLRMQYDCLSYDEPPHLSSQYSLENPLLQQTPTYSQNRPENIYEDTAEDARNKCGDNVSTTDYDCSKDYVETSHLLSQSTVKHLPSQLKPNPQSSSISVHQFKSVSNGIDEKNSKNDNTSEYNCNKYGSREEFSNISGEITDNCPEKGPSEFRFLKPPKAFEISKADKSTETRESESALDDNLSFAKSKRSSSSRQISKDEFSNTFRKQIYSSIADTWLHTENGYVIRVSRGSSTKCSPSTEIFKDISPSYSMKIHNAETSKSNLDLNLEMKDSQEKLGNVYAKTLSNAIFKESSSSRKNSESYFSSRLINSEEIPPLQSPQGLDLSVKKISPQKVIKKENHYPAFSAPDQSSLSFKTSTTSFTFVNSGVIHPSESPWGSLIPAESSLIPSKTDLGNVCGKSSIFTTPYQTSTSSQMFTDSSAENILNWSTSVRKCPGVSNNSPVRKIPQVKREKESCTKYLTIFPPKQFPQSSETSTDNSSCSVIRAEPANILKLPLYSNATYEKISRLSSREKETSAKHDPFALDLRLSTSFKTFAEDSSQGIMNPEALTLSQSSECCYVRREITPRKRKSCNETLSIATQKQSSPYLKMSTDDSSSSVMRPEGSHISKLSASYSISSEKRSQESTWEIEASAKHQSFSTLEQLSPSFKTNTEDDSSLSSKIPEALSLSQSPESRNVSEKLHQDEPEGEKVVVNLCQGRQINDHPRIPKNDSMNSVESRDPVHPSQSPQENIDLKKYIYPKRLDKRRVREISNIYYSG